MLILLLTRLIGRISRAHYGKCQPRAVCCLGLVDALGVLGRTFKTHMANVSCELSVVWVLKAPESYQQRIGANVYIVNFDDER